MNPDHSTPCQEDILIVDDSMDNLRVLSSTLVNRGYSVRCVKSGAMALIGAQSSPPDLILLDIRMPGMDGYETCQRLKANLKTQAIPIIFLSALDDVMDKVKAFEVGGVDYITKPFQVEEVLVRVENQLTIQRLQNQLIHKNQQLQQEICERQKTEVALRDAKEAAEAANRAKSDFLAKMSHELRTPLTAILGFTGLMQGDQSLPTEYQDYLATILRTSQHLLKLINNILTIAQSSNSRISLNEQRFDLQHLLTLLEQHWRSQAELKGILFSSESAPGVPQYVYSDEGKLRQILNNLLENAITSTAVGAVTLRVSPIVTSEPFDLSHASSLAKDSRLITLQFEVEDPGIGVTGHTLNIVSESLPELSEQRTCAPTEFDLSISRQFIQRMGGDISVSSTPSQGTITSFYIPTALAEMEHDLLQPSLQNLLSNLQQDVAMSIEEAQSSQLQALNGGEDIPPDSLQTLMPEEWLVKLHHAAIKGFDRQILQLIQDIPPSHLSLANVLKHWAANFQFQQILELTTPSVEGN